MDSKIILSPGRLEPEREIDTPRFAIVIFLLYVAAMLTTKQGADAPQYFRWQQYFSTFDLNALNMFESSATGVPLIQHQYGSGLLAAIPNILFGTIPTGMFLTGAFLGFANLSMLLFLVRRHFASRESVLLATACFLLFTPAIYYLNAYSTEGWTILLSLAGLSCIEWYRANPRHLPYCTSGLAVVFYFLLLVRATNIILCAALALIFYAEIFGRFPQRLNIGSALKRILAVSAPLAAASGLAIVFMGSLNLVMNGNFWASSYNFHDAEYSALSLRHAKFAEILFAAWHGLAPYHPVMFCAVIWLIRAGRRDLVSLSALGAFFFQLVLQASWYGWWMGLNTFGARAFCGVSVLIAYALLRTEAFTWIVGRARTYLAILMVVLATYEAWLVGQAITNYTDYWTFFESLRSERSLVLLVLFGLWGALVLLLGRRAGFAPRHRPLIYALGLYLFCLLPSAVYSHAALDALLARTPMLLGIALCFAAGSILLLLNLQLRRFVYRTLGTAYQASGGVALGVLAVAFVTSVYAQVAMLRNFSASAHAITPGVPTFYCPEPVVTLQEYDLVQGYEADKAALRAFLKRSGCPDSI